MQTYICKCGKTFEKSTTADTTGYVLQDFSPQHECFGCPYIVTERDWVTQKITKQECRATPKIQYRSFTDIGTDDKDFRTCYLYLKTAAWQNSLSAFRKTRKGLPHGEK